MEEFDGPPPPPEERSSRPKRMTFRSCLRYNILLLLMISAMITGIAFGLLMRKFYPTFRNSDRYVMYLEFPGKLVLSMLKVLIVPLIATTLIASIASLPSKAQGRLGGFTVAYYLITTFMAVILGVILVSSIKPGVRDEATRGVREAKGNAVDTFLDIVRNIFPDNIVEAAFRTTKTEVDTNRYNATVKGVHVITQNITDEFEVVKVFRTNTLGIITFSIAFGVMVSLMQARGKILAEFFTAFSEAMMKLTTVVVYVVPLGIIFLVASKIVQSEDLEEDFKSLAMYIVTVLAGLVIHGFIILPLILFLLARRNPFYYVVHMARALITALATASSAATMPLTLKCLRENAKINPLVANFVIPVGATVNMDGTALYEAVASIFLAQQLGMDLNPGDYVIVSVTATLAAIGAAGIPEAGLVTMLIVLQALGIPYDSVGFILAVDWFLDRCRTTINVWGDSIGAAVVERLTKGYLKAIEDDDIVLVEDDSSTPPPSYVPYRGPHNDSTQKIGSDNPQFGVYTLQDVNSLSESTHL